VRIHPHAWERVRERGAAEDEVETAIRGGERFPAKFGREGFRCAFPFDGLWRGRGFATKQGEVIATYENDDWLAISVIVKYL
jgi:hypothetical protein